MLIELSEKLLFKNVELTGKADQKRIATLTPTSGIAETRDLVYINDGNPLHLLDIYCPEGAAAPLPVIIDIHGGGWTYGDKELNKYYCLYLASLGFSVVNISYPLCPETTIPGQIKDCFAVFNWLDENGSKYNCDMSNVFITGDSAGGHLAMVCVAITGRGDLPEIFGVEPPKFRFGAAGFVCGGFDPIKLFNIRFPVTQAYKRMCLGTMDTHPLEKHLNCSDLLDNTELPPLYLVSSKEDFVRRQSIGFARALSGYGIPHAFHYWDRIEDKKLPHVFPVLYPYELEESVVTTGEMINLFKENIKRKARIIQFA